MSQSRKIGRTILYKNVNGDYHTKRVTISIFIITAIIRYTRYWLSREVGEDEALNFTRES